MSEPEPSSAVADQTPAPGPKSVADPTPAADSTAVLNQTLVSVPALIDDYRRQQEEWRAQTAALAAMDDHAHIARTLENNSEQAEALGVGLSDLGFRVVPTWGNFVYCNVGQQAAGLAQRLREQGVSIRPLEAWGAPGCIRVTIGTPDQNEVLRHAIQQTLGKKLDAKVVKE